MKKPRRKIERLLLFLSILVVFTSFSSNVFTVAATSGGSCGQTATWSYDYDSKTLIISGKGAIKNYTRNYEENKIGSENGYYTTAPWWPYYKEVEHLIIEEGITSVGSWSFYFFRNIKSVYLPSSLRIINDRAFHCFAGSFKEIVLPNGLQEIGEYAFDGSEIERIVIPGSLTTIPVGAFHFCDLLKEVIIEDGCTKIGSYAFNNCFVLSDITIPATIQKIDKYALCRQNPSNDWYAYSGYKGLCIYGENNSYAKKFATNNDISFITLSNTNNSLEYPIYNNNEYVKLLRNWAENSEYAISFSNWIAQGHTYEELLNMTVDIPIKGNDGGIYSVNGNTTIKDLMSYIIFADISQDYILNSLENVRYSFKENNAKDAYLNFFSDIKNFQSQYYYFQNKLNGGNDFQQTMYSLLLAKTILTVVDNTSVKDVRYAFDVYKGSISESPEHYDNLYYYVMSGGDTRYLNSSYGATMKGLGLAVKDSKSVVKVVKKGISSSEATSYITLSLDNLSYFADVYEWDYKDKIKKAKEAWTWADNTIEYAKAITTFSFSGTLSSSWKLANTYIDEVKKVYTDTASADAGWYALTYFYLMGNNERLFNALIDGETGSAEFGFDRIIKYGVPYDENDIIERNIVKYWNNKSYLTYSYTPNEDMRFYLWNACNTANAIMEIDEEDYRDMMLQYILAEVNLQSGVTGIEQMLSVTANDNTLGKVSGAGQYKIDSMVTVTATPYNNVNFLGWKNLLTDEIISTNSSYTIKLNSDMYIQAVFVAENASSAQSPIITSQPQNITIWQGDNSAKIDVIAYSPDNGTISVAWYRNTVNGIKGGEFVANGASFRLDTSDEGVFYYYAVVTNKLTDYVGTNEVVTTASKYSDIIKVTINEPIITDLSIIALPSKQTYNVGENLDTTGMKVMLHYSNGTSLLTNNYFLAYDFSQIGKQKVVVSSLNCSDSFTVNIICEHEFAEWIVGTPATPDALGYKHRTCRFCGMVESQEIPKVESLAFKGASLTLYDNLAINYKVDAALFEEIGYTNPYVKFVINGVETVVTDYSIVGDRYVFDFKDIAPYKMNDTVYATLYAEYKGVTYQSETREYSVATYCYNMLDKYSDDKYAEFRTLLVDLLNYGVASQEYTDYRLDNLVNNQLTETQAAWGTADKPQLETVLKQDYKVVDNPKVTWKGAGLSLRDSVIMRFKIATDDIKNLKVKVTGKSGGEWYIASDSFEKTDGGYYVYFGELGASRMSEEVYLTVYDGDIAVSNTVRYSIESYAYAKQNTTDKKLKNLILSIMKYGDSAYNYVY